MDFRHAVGQQRPQPRDRRRHLPRCNGRRQRRPTGRQPPATTSQATTERRSLHGSADSRTTVPVQIYEHADGSGELSLFIDFNGDGDFADAGEPS
ncbi:MAG: hypothetical protein R2856_34755 [Caldilineaceae bacterium]